MKAKHDELTDIEPLDPETIIGCGANIGEFMLCRDCANDGFDYDECAEVRQDAGWDQMKARDYKGE